MKTAIRRRRPSRPRPLVESLERRELLASVAGSLDPTFGSGRGYEVTQIAQPSTTGPSINNDTITGVFDLPDGKVEVAAVVTQGNYGSIEFSTTTSSFVLFRFNADGTPDATFGTGGQVPVGVPFSTTYFSGAEPGGSIGGSVVMEPDGKILAGGNLQTGPAYTTSPPSAFAVIRVNLDGSLDSTFGQGGLATYASGVQTSANPGLTSVSSLAVQPDGKVVLVGQSYGGMDGTTFNFAAVRLDANGSIDDGFGTGGITTIVTGPEASAVAIQPNGGIVSVGTNFVPGLANNTLYEVLRLDSTGKLDMTFGADSYADVYFPGEVVLPALTDHLTPVDAIALGGIAIQGDDKIVISSGGIASTYPNVIVGDEVARLNADGSRDTGFGTSGIVATSVTGPVAIQNDGKIVVGGAVTTFAKVNQNSGDRTVFAAARLNADGSVDASYGNTSTAGLARYNFGAQTTGGSVTDLAIQPDGNLLLAGSTTSTYFYNGGSTSITGPLHFGLAGVLGQATTGVAAKPAPATPPAAFDGSGVTNIAVYLPSTGSFYYRPKYGNADVVVPFGIAGAGQTLPAAADYEGIGVTDIAAYLPSLGLYAIRPAGGGADEVFPFGIAGADQSIPVPADYDGDGKADVAVYMPSIAAFGIRPSGGGPDQIIPFGFAGVGSSIPAPGDYDGDGKADLAVYLPALGAFVYRPSSGGPDVLTAFGLPGAGKSIPMPGDYDGSGKTELAVYLPSLGLFAYRPAGGGPDVVEPFGIGGAGGSIPAEGDYDGDGKTDLAIYLPSLGEFAVRYSSVVADQLTPFGAGGAGQTLPVASLPTPSTVSAASVHAEAVATTKAATVVGSAIPSVATTRRKGLVAVAQGKDLGGSKL